MGIGTERGDPFGGGVPGDPGTQASERGAGGWGFDPATGEFGYGPTPSESLQEKKVRLEKELKTETGRGASNLRRDIALVDKQIAAQAAAAEVARFERAAQAESAAQAAAVQAAERTKAEAAINAALKKADEEAALVEAEEKAKKTGTFLGRLAQTALKLTGIGTLFDVDETTRELIEDYYMKPEVVERFKERTIAGEDPEELANSLTRDDFTQGSQGQQEFDKEGGTAPISTTAAATTTAAPAASDPSTLDFWSQFVTEFANTKKMFQEDQAFKQKQVQPAMQKYRERLQGISGEPLHQPITWGMGDFRSTFMPKSSQGLAQNVLGSELAETEVMMPNTANRAYLDMLYDVAQKDRSLKQNLAIANINAPYRDKGSWLDTLSDIVKLGGTVSDVWQSTKD